MALSMTLNPFPHRAVRKRLSSKSPNLSAGASAVAENTFSYENRRTGGLGGPNVFAECVGGIAASTSEQLSDEIMGRNADAKFTLLSEVKTTPTVSSRRLSITRTL